MLSSSPITNADFKGNAVHSLDSHREEKEPRKEKKTKLVAIDMLSFALFSSLGNLHLYYNAIS